MVNGDAPSFNFDMLHGLETVIDPFRPAMFDPTGRHIDSSGQRVQALTRHGVTIGANDQFLVAITSYRGAGGGNFPGLHNDHRILRTPLDMRTALDDDVVLGGLPPSTTGSVWRFAPALGQRVVIETSPQAAKHLDDIAGFDPQIIGENAGGFLELSVAM